MSFINFLGIDDPTYGKYAKGILYVIYEILWKIVHAIGRLVDSVTGLFYKLAGLNYMGSGSEEVVEETDLLGQIFNQNIVSKISIFMIVASVLLMTVFGTIAVLKRMYFSRGEVKSSVDVIRNMVLAGVFLVFLSPIALFAISSISTITTAIASLFGNDMSVSIADVMFRSSFSEDPVAIYNTIYSSKVAEGETWTNINSWVEMTNNDFLFEMAYGGTVNVNFYWYIFLLGGAVILYNIVVIAFRLIKRIFNVVVLYLIGPVYVAKMVDDGGTKFREWKNKALAELVSIVGTVVAFMILLSLVTMIDGLELIETGVATGSGALGEIPGLVEGGSTPVEPSPSALLINNLAKILLLMAGTAVAKDSGELLGNVFKGENAEGNILLEGIYERLSQKEAKSTTGAASSPRTRVVTKNTTTTRRIVDYSEAIATTPNNQKSHVNVTNNQRNNFNTTVNNIDRKTTNLQNRTNVDINAGIPRTSNEGVKAGNYRNPPKDDKGKLTTPNDILNQTFTNYKRENDKIRNEWEFVKNGNSTDSKQVVKDFESASKDLDASISTGEQNKIKTSMNKYVDAYRKEEKVAKEGYKDFAGKSAKLSNDLTMKQQQELRNISNAYRKAQVDYGKTARRLSQVSEGNISTTEALRVKERADKQREKLMDASTRASNFYNNLKKGG